MVMHKIYDTAVAKHLGVKGERIIFGNGSDELISNYYYEHY